MIFDVDDVYEIEESYKIKLENKDKEIERLKGVYGKNLELVDKMYVKDKEIERLNNQIEKYKYLHNRLSNKSEYTIKCLNKELQQKENIIKEVREYIMSNLITEWDIKHGGYVSGSDLPVDAITPILEILDKEVN